MQEYPNDPQRRPDGQPAAGEQPYSPAAAPKKKKRRWPAFLVGGLFCAGFALVVVLFCMVAEKEMQIPLSDGPVSEHLHLSPIREDGLSTREIAAKASPSVVGINVYSSAQVYASAGASGIVLNTDGYIITNSHVVEDAARITVVFDDGGELAARVVGYDSRTDLAVVKVDPAGRELIPAEFGDSTLCCLGDDVVAIGNSSGFYNSVTRGVISGLGREVDVNVGIKLMQTDAAINPGNSGGALLNSAGQVIGINSAKIVGSDVDGVGFAIPISEAKPIIDQLISRGRVTDRAMLGVTIVPLNKTTGSMYGLPEQGLYISQIYQNANLFKAGVTRGDILLEADGKKLSENEDLMRILEAHKPGDEMSFTVSFADGSESSVTVILQSAEEFSAE